MRSSLCWAPLVALSYVLFVDGTTTSTFACPSGKYVTGISGYTGTIVDGIQFTCDDGTVSSYFGGHGGNSISNTCSIGYSSVVVSSVSTYFSDSPCVSQIIPTCGSTAGNALGSESSSPTTFNCPSGQLIRGVTVTTNVYLDTIQFICGVDFFCPPLSYLTSISGRSGTLTDAISFVCSDSLSTSSGLLGGTGGSVFSNSCPAGYTAVATGNSPFGFNGDFPVVSQVLPYCQGVAQTALGTTANTLVTTSCPAGQLINGATILYHNMVMVTQFTCGYVVFNCPANKYIRSFAYSSGGVVDAFSMVCSDGSSSLSFGGSGGGAGTDSCPTGISQYAVGTSPYFQTNAPVVSQIIPYCLGTAMASIGTAYTSAATLMSCPAGQLLVGATVSYHNYIMGVKFNCSFIRTISPTTVPTYYPTSPSMLPSFKPTVCPTMIPTISPTYRPTTSPTATPSIYPTMIPTMSATTPPTSSPTYQATISPTFAPTLTPTFSPTTSPTCAVTLCSAGRFSTNTSVCSTCPAGQYTSLSDQSSCSMCPAGLYNNMYTQGSTSMCVPCAAGSYANAGVGATECLPCPAGSYSYLGATACTLCAAGLFSPSIGHTNCMPCLPGTFAGSGASMCQSCLAHIGSAAFANNCTSTV